jgi:hypothetical protein
MPRTEPATNTPYRTTAVRRPRAFGRGGGARRTVDLSRSGHSTRGFDGLRGRYLAVDLRASGARAQWASKPSSPAGARGESPFYPSPDTTGLQRTRLHEHSSSSAVGVRAISTRWGAVLNAPTWSIVAQRFPPAPNREIRQSEPTGRCPQVVDPLGANRLCVRGASSTVSTEAVRLGLSLVACDRAG